ncbi:GNAT family N-acetyltransferase [Faecalimicrobium sp. JNUCC 81]
MNIWESNRLILRTWAISDLDDLHEIMSNKSVAHLAGFNARTNLNDSFETLKKFVKEPANSIWAIELKEISKVIGWIELHEPVEGICEGSKEIGFVLSQAYWGQGFMPEAIKILLIFAFNKEKLDCVICSHFENNIQSKKVIEKCGFEYNIKHNDKIYYSLKNTR